MRRFLTIAVAVAAAVAFAETPDIVVGIVSDVHMNPDDDTHLCERRFRRALEFFDAQKADAVAGCGDYVEFGWTEWYRLLGKYWFERFPENRRSDGQPVVPLFAYGDHEMESRWNGNITRRFSREYILARDIPTYGRGKLYEETLKEPWVPVTVKRVKGYDFVLGHFTMREDDDGNICDEGKNVPWGEHLPAVERFFATNRMDKSRPFFYFQHLPPRGTVISPLVTGQDDGSATRIFSDYPNSVVFCGHRHKSATSERNLWQGAFTCVQVPAMECVQTDAGHENGWASCDGYVPADPPQQMPKMRAYEDGGQCLLMRVYRKRIVIERWNVDYREKVGEDWVIPVASADRGSATFEARAKGSKPVAFPDGAEVKVERRRGKDRAGNPSDQYVVTFPQARSDAAHARGYDYRVTARVTKHWWTRTACEKWVYSEKCFLPESRDTKDVTCVFSKAEVPGPFERVCFEVTPYNAFGQAGHPISSPDIKYAAFPTPPAAERLPEASLDRGGLTFDFAALSDRRFDLDVPKARNLVQGTTEGGADFVSLFDLPDSAGGDYRLSFRYRMPNTFPIRQDAYSLGGCRLEFDCGGKRYVNILVAVGDWYPYVRSVEVPKGVRKVTLRMDLHKDAQFTFRDLAFVKEPPRPELDMRIGTHANLGNEFEVPAGQCALLTVECRKSPAATFDSGRLAFAVTLPKGVEFVDTTMGDAKTVKVRRRPDGGSRIVFARRADVEVETGWDSWGQGILVRADEDLPRGRLGVGRIDAFVDNRRVGGSGEIVFLGGDSIPTVRAPHEYFQGVDFGGARPRVFNTEKAQLEYAKFMAGCGLRAVISAGDTPRTREILHRGGVRYVLPDLRTCANGYMMGQWKDLPPEDIRFVFDADPAKGEHENKRSRSVCPIAIYSESDWFRREYLPSLARDLKGSDGLWANWELYMFIDKGCFCSKCRKAFAERIGVADSELATDWPRNALGTYKDKWNEFRSWQHAQVVRTIDRHVTELTGGEKSLGFVPGLEWADLSSCWREENLAAQYRPVAYAGDLKWIEPWGPYATWMSEHPYFYTKYTFIAPFFAAADLRRQVDADYPLPKRPKLMSYPQGIQGGTWVGQPESIGMSLDSYFFNRWEASVLYHFPKGADARYWRAFAASAARAGRYENHVRKGRETTSFVSLKPVAEYAVPVAYATRFVPWSKDASLLQARAFSFDGVRIVAVFNFWQKGEAFFDLQAKGLDGRLRVIDEDGVLYLKDDGSELWSAKELADGIRLMVGAMRTKVFEIIPEANPVSAKSVMTRRRMDELYRKRQETLRRAAEEDRRYERDNSTPTRDCYPMI